MNRFVVACLLLSVCCFCYAQNSKTDSLDRLIMKATSDTQRINLKVEKIKVLGNINLDSAIALALRTVDEAKRINYKKGEVNVRINLANDYNFIGNYVAAKENLDLSNQLLAQVKDSNILASLYNVYGNMYAMQNKYDSSHIFFDKGIAISTLTGNKSKLSSLLQNNAISFQQQSNYPLALLNYQKALEIAEQLNDEENEAFIFLNIAITYNTLDDTTRAEQYYLKAVSLAKKMDLKNVEAYAYANLSALYAEKNKYADQYSFGIKAAELGKQLGDAGIQASSLSRAALALANQKKFSEAKTLNKQAMAVADSSKQPLNTYQTYANMGKIFTMTNEFSLAIPYLETALHSLTDADLYSEEVGSFYSDLSNCYEKTGDYSKALAMYKLSAKITDSVRGKDNVRKATELTMNYEFEKKQQVEKVEQARKDAAAQKVKNQQYFIIAALALVVLAVVIIALIQFRNNKQKRRANLLLEKQKLQIENTLAKLKNTQAQLIQSEKMASLGELTAGIAHEIQNPLNFVNNFSEVNSELIDEMNAETNLEEIKAIANDVKQNNEKVTFHGKRADAIVKGMLQHSRKSSGQKEPTDINALCDEYLRLSYHGLRAKDKSFIADFRTDFDTSIGKISIVPQDIGRVLLNLFNNAFYAVNNKKKTAGENYKPLVSVTTRTSKLPGSNAVSNSPLGVGGFIEIIIKDNGSGIPQHIIDKIFQPFFTTKPTGDGTGLGLSMSYDIITKEHNGTITVESKEGEGSMFTIKLPN